MTHTDIAHKIATAPLFDDPFHHARLSNILPTYEYAQMLHCLPPIDHCHELRHRDAVEMGGKSTRLQFGFTPQEWHNLDADSREFWVHFLAAFLHPDVTEAVIERLRAGMEQRFGSTLNKARLKPCPWLLRDQDNYRIGIHPDHHGKVVTLQLYLPADDSMRGLGTVFYRQARPLKHPAEQGKPAHDEDQDKFDVVHRMEFVPNSGYMFVVADNSWHGVDRVASPVSRDSFMIHYNLV